MIEFIEICVAPATLPYTLLLLGVLGYWVVFLVGIVGLDTLDIDLELDADANFDLPGDAPAQLPVGPDSPLHGMAPAVAPAWVSFVRFFHVGEVPLMILLSILILNLWGLSVIENYYLNPSGNFWFGLAMLIPNLILGLFGMKIMTAPLRYVFRHAGDGACPPVQLVGKTCIITTSEVTPRFGQAQVAQDGAPIVLNVRCRDGVRLVRGQEAVIWEFDEAKNTYTVAPFDLEAER